MIDTFIIRNHYQWKEGYEKGGYERMRAMREFEIFEISHSLHSIARCGGYKSSFMNLM